MLSSSNWKILSAILLLIGIGLRVRMVQLNNSLWLDEASLALNVLSRSFFDLLLPLDHSQGAPVLFLWLEKLSVLITGSSSEYALRLVPLLSGSAACVGVFAICQHFKLSGARSLCAVALVSFSPGLIHFSGQAKQYSTDVFIAIALYLVSVRFLDKPNPRNSFVYGLVGLFSIGLSHPSVFILAGVGATVLIDAWRKGDRPRLIIQFSIVCVWLIGFALNFFFFLRPLSHIPGMVDYWKSVYQPYMPLSPQAPKWLFHAGVDVAKMAAFTPEFILPIAVVGVPLLWRQDWRISTMLYFPVALAIFASSLQLYPFADRMILFTLPAILISAGVTFSAMFSSSSRAMRLLTLGIFSLLLFTPAKRAAALAVYPERFRLEEFRDTFLDVVGTSRCQDSILIYERAANHYRYYNRFRWSQKYTATIVTAPQLVGASFGTLEENSTKPADIGVSLPKNRSCFWLVFAHTSDTEVPLLSNSMIGRGYKETATLGRVGASAHLFTLP